ncbi:MAG: MinD/ParA family protein [Phycisphaerae bacterium]|nr:MinD/ParA family protein [Phycisphaerae bacterium]
MSGTSDQADRLRALVRESRGVSRLVAVTSGKGGVGKTNLAVNAAICLAARGQRVVLIDADLGLANADVLLDVKAPYNLGHVISGEKNIDEVLVDAPGGIKLILGTSGVGRLANLSEFERHNLVQSMLQLESLADVVVLDCAAGISRNVITFAAAADHVLVVTTPEPTALTDAYATIKVLSRERTTASIGTVVNLATNSSEARSSAARLSEVARRFLRMDVDNTGYVLKDEHVALAVRHRVPVILRYPRSPASTCLAAVANTLARETFAGRSEDSFFRRVANFFF